MKKLFFFLALALCAITPAFAQAQDVTPTVGDINVALEVTVATGTPPLSYAWFKNGQSLAGQTSSLLVFPVLQASDAGTYRAEVSNAKGKTVSPDYVFTVAPLVIAPAGAVIRILKKS